MKLSTKGRYAMVALVDIAMQPEGDLVTLSDISKRQSVSLPYLEQLFVKLRRADLVQSVRGPGGGYKLARPTTEIRVVDILAAVDETVDAMHTGAGASGGLSGSKPPVAGSVGTCLCVPASDASVGCCGQRDGALSCGAVLVRYRR